MQAAWRIGLLSTLLVLGTGCGRNAVFGLGQPGEDAAVADGGAPSDGEVTFTDIGVQVDAGAPSDDGGDPALDGGAPSDDGGTPMDDGGIPAEDGGPAPDGGDPATDAGTPADAGNPADAGTPTDAGTPIPDAGTPVPDGGLPPPGDACTTDADCGFQRPHCHPTLNVCVDCLADSDCRGGQTCDTTYGFECRLSCLNGSCGPIGECDPATGLCYECLTDSDCNGAEICHPTSRTCVTCATDADCALAPNRPFCDPQEDACRGCRSDADCPMGETCFDSQGGFCAPATGRAQCTPCTDDAQCGGPNDLCIGAVTTGGFVDRSCSRDCSNAPCDPGFECTSVRNGSMVCRPSYAMSVPTCTAERNRGEACRVSQIDVDPGCGISGVQDARCIATASGAPGVCSFWCQDNADCPQGTTCTPAGNVSVCL